MNPMMFMNTEGVELMTIETYLETLGSIVTAVFEWVVDVLGIITSNPILLVPFGVIACYTAVSLLKKIF